MNRLRWCGLVVLVLFAVAPPTAHGDDEQVERKEVTLEEYNAEIIRIEGLRDLLTADRQRLLAEYLASVKIRVTLKLKDLQDSGGLRAELIGPRGQRTGPGAGGPYARVDASGLPRSLDDAALRGLNLKRWDRLVFMTTPNDQGVLALSRAEFLEHIPNPGIEWIDLPKRRGGFKRLLKDAEKAHGAGKINDFLLEFFGQRLAESEAPTRSSWRSTQNSLKSPSRAAGLAIETMAGSRLPTKTC